jgi:transcriptional regulator with XRE-family HTH domain
MTAMISPDELRRALGEARMTQADLARETHFTPVTVHRWATGKAPLRGSTAEAVAAILRAHGVAVGLAPDCRVFLASPMAALDPAGYEQARADAEAVHAALARVAGPVYWPAGGIGSAAGFEAPDLATARNLAALHACEAFVYLQVGRLDRPTSCHIELGWALALGKPVTVLAPSEEDLPYMLRRYEIVAGRDGGWYRFHPVGDALRLLDIHGAELLGLPAAVTA